MRRWTRCLSAPSDTGAILSGLTRVASPLVCRRRGCDRSTTSSGAEGSGAEASDRTGRPAETPEASLRGAVSPAASFAPLLQTIRSKPTWARTAGSLSLGTRGRQELRGHQHRPTNAREDAEAAPCGCLFPWLCSLRRASGGDRTIVAAGKAASQSRPRVRRREQVRTVHDMLTALGMDAFAERAQIELVATGEKVPKRTVKPPTISPRRSGRSLGSRPMACPIRRSVRGCS